MGKPLSARDDRATLKGLAERVAFKAAVSPLGFRLRMLTNKRRMMPTYVVVGTQKGGTTFLHALLAQHPQVREPIRKEINYFSFGMGLGAAWYRANFPMGRPGLVTGEATTNYMFHPLAPERMARMLPDAKVLVCLREPASRALSHWQMNRLNGYEDLSFPEAIDREEERISSEREQILTDFAYPAWSYRRFSYRARGLYLEQLQRLEAQYPRENIMVLDSTDLFKRTEETLEQVERFLGLEEWIPNSYRPENVAKHKEPVDQGAMEELKRFFRPHDAALFDHLGWTPRW